MSVLNVSPRMPDDSVERATAARALKAVEAVQGELLRLASEMHGQPRAVSPGQVDRWEARLISMAKELEGTK